MQQALRNAAQAVSQVAPDLLSPAALSVESTKALRAALGDALIAADTRRFPESVLDSIDTLLIAETEAALAPLPPTAHNLGDNAVWRSTGQTQIVAWKGDILSLDVGAIVNAANDGGLGCFVSAHRCIDNIIHRAAGPRLRNACAEKMKVRPRGLTAGSPPIVTGGFHLNADIVVHTTGPQLRQGAEPTRKQVEQLAAAYSGSLAAAAAAGVRSIAFPCISTGLFSFPSEEAARIATETVFEWLSDPVHADAFDTVVFSTYTDRDQEAYATLLGQADESADPLMALDEQPAICVEARAIADADRVLIVAAAGLSISDTLPNNVYHSAADFAHHYPQTVKYGYRTGYQAMGLSGDPDVPEAVKQAHMAKHFLNMRYNFPPTDAYHQLKRFADTFAKEDVFVWTSNVDGCFERAGFDPARVYTCQGEMNKLQCANSDCGHIWDCTEQLKQIVAASPNGVLTDMSLRCRCPNCERIDILPSLRGGDWFDHSPYEPVQDALLEWLNDSVARSLSVAVIEVGVGGNTPIVTRIPASSFATAVGASGGLATYLRVNPDAADIRRYATLPSSEYVQLFNICAGWDALKPILDEGVERRQMDKDRGDRSTGRDSISVAEARRQMGRYTEILMSLRTPR